MCASINYSPTLRCFLSNKQKKFIQAKVFHKFHAKKYLFKLKTRIKIALFVKSSKIHIPCTIYPRVLNKAFLKS